MGEFDNQVCVVTGGGRGIGRAIVQMFRNEGGIIYSVDLELPPSGAGGVQQCRCDISNLLAVETVFETIRRNNGRVDVLVNNAATVTRATPFAALQPDEWDKALSVNITGTFNVTRTALKLMSRGGRIINMASTFAHVGAPNRVAYSTTKGAIVAFSRSLALDLADQGIRVNSISPGAIATDRLIEQFGSERAAEDALVPLHPIGRLGQSAEIADAVWYLASTRAAFLTGSDIRVDGGYTAR